MDVFLTKFGHEGSVIFSKWTFLWRNMGMRTVIFSRKIGKNGILLTLGAHNIVYFWQNWCFLTEHGHDSGMFIMNTFWKKDMRALFFERMDVFLTKCGHESGLFFREWTWRFFDEIWAREQLFFREKSARHGRRLGKILYKNFHCKTGNWKGNRHPFSNVKNLSQNLRFDSIGKLRSTG